MPHIWSQPWRIFLLIVCCSTLLTLGEAHAQSNKVDIRNRGSLIQPAETTEIFPGFIPEVNGGNILNAHYAPGLMDYSNGNYKSAVFQMSYFLRHPEHTRRNPRQAELFSHAHYIRGMVYAYHAFGSKRYQLAKKDFESSIQWNPKNYTSYLELARVLTRVQLIDLATSVLHRLLELNPEEAIAQQAKKDLGLLQATAAQR